MKYKAETASGVENTTICAHESTRYPDIVICEERLDDKAMASIDKRGFFELSDPDYMRWLEEKLMDLL